ncbi:MAG: phosphate-starvation-inducible PsiE family protein [Thermoproteus sp.]
MDYIKWLRSLEIFLYGLALVVTAVLAGYSFYLVVLGIIGLSQNATEYSVYLLLSNLFLFIIFIELLDTFITYIQNKEVIVYKIIDVALVALARELIVYISPANSNFDIAHAAVLTAATLAIGIVDYLQHRRTA